MSEWKLTGDSVFIDYDRTITVDATVLSALFMFIANLIDIMGGGV